MGLAGHGRKMFSFGWANEAKERYKGILESLTSAETDRAAMLRSAIE